MNNDAPSISWPSGISAERRVLDHQLKLHRWARSERDCRFDDVFNLICDQATLSVAWERVSGNRGARTAGVDGVTRFHVEERHGVFPFLEELRSSLKDGSFRALPVKRAVIPKKNGKVRYLGIPALRDRVAQMALKLVPEPIFEVDFHPSSYGYRPGRRAQDAIAEIHHLTSRPSNYEWVVEGDIKACFDNVDHHVLMDLVAERVKDRKVLRLVSAFLRAGVVELQGWIRGVPHRNSARGSRITTVGQRPSLRPGPAFLADLGHRDDPGLASTASASQGAAELPKTPRTDSAFGTARACPMIRWHARPGICLSAWSTRTGGAATAVRSVWARTHPAQDQDPRHRRRRPPA
ncbi:reverse transcriptase domain-containing protein, partial [Embleya scabrispora]|uniref:reverse transcriptase domain-containing protein n=1 Tax=Embleya scabrispora TaxID=159449 RepID=UPI001FDF8781